MALGEITSWSVLAEASEDSSAVVVAAVAVGMAGGVVAADGQDCC